MIYDFEQCTLDTATQELHREGELIAVEPQVFAVLEYLLANPGRVVSKIELFDQVWGDRFVSESALTSRIKLARQACGDSGRAQRIIKTVHGRGYRMVAEIAERGRGAPVRAAAAGGLTAVGREIELERLGEVADRARLGDLSMVFVTGPAGAGKTTVVSELLERIEDLDRWLVLRGRCHRSRSGPEPYFALLDALGALALSEPDLVRNTLDRVAPSWLLQLPALCDEEVASRLERRLLGGARQRMLREGADAFGALARERPTMLVLEDLHEADDCTLDVLEMLAGRPEPIPLLVLVTSRPGVEAVDQLVAEAQRGGAAAELPLAPLDQAAISQLVRDRHPDGDVDPRVVELLHSRCDGNPLFANEILTAWESAGLIRDDGATVTPTADPDALTAMIPPGVLALIERSLNRLEADELAILESAAAAGTRFDAASVAAGLDRPLDQVENGLSRMARRPDHIDVVGAATWADGTVSTEYRFTHQMHRDVLHDRTPVGRRIELHRRIGLALEAANRTSVGDLSATLADHFLVAGDRSRAAGHLRRVGAQALARQAPARAEHVLEQALSQCDQLTPGEERDELELDIRLSLGQARVGVAGWSDPTVAQHYERALVLAGELDSVDREAHARYALATISEMNGNFERTEELLTPVLTAGGEELEMEAHELVACSTFHQGAFGRSEDNAGTVLETWPEDTSSEVMARVAEHPATSCNSWMSLTNWFLGRSDESLRRAENAVRLGERHRYALAMATQQRAMLHQLREEPEACREWADRTLALDRPLLTKVRRLQGEILRHWAFAALAAGEGRDGSDPLVAMADVLQQFRNAGVRLDGPYFIALHADALLRHGRAAEAVELLDEADERIDTSTRAYFHRAEIRRLRARATVELGGPDARTRAREELDEALADAMGMGSPPMALRVVCDRFELELDGGDPDLWRQRLSDLVGRYDGQRPPADVVRGKALLTS